MHHEYRIMWILLHEFVNSSRIMWMLLHESWISIFFVNWGIHIMLAGPRYNIVSILWWHISPPKSLPNLHPKLQSVLFQKEKPIILQIYFSTKKTKILQKRQRPHPKNTKYAISENNTTQRHNYFQHQSKFSAVKARSARFCCVVVAERIIRSEDK